MLCSQPCLPTISTGPCPPTVAGPYAAWMPRKSLHGRTCGVSCDGGRARTLQPSRRSAATNQSADQSPCSEGSDHRFAIGCQRAGVPSAALSPRV
ncbi:hypothetical protein XarbCFBP7408_14430 [Xanthomonas arboricola pv. guizotiae]|uniref:Uncharacterized protein n=1 Tax=Xanthomonas arboricola pv. guizotiae TaxID=487867 RepID=A0A2S6ZU56_9XANT|nr:hypothetical protein XarbCFBP7409_16480 [Xanthomonas arboricola pv. guizotiae]PPU22631.1 hypothetical protein XarbCFBP7408_14430 [Xanthomonas arboricola pv. guizotiae]